MLTEEISDVEAILGGPVVVGLLAGRRLPPAPLHAADGEHPRRRRRRGHGAGEKDPGNGGREQDAGHGLLALWSVAGCRLLFLVVLCSEPAIRCD